MRPSAWHDPYMSNTLHVGPCSETCLCVRAAKDIARAEAAWKRAVTKFKRALDADAREANEEPLWRAAEGLRRMGSPLHANALGCVPHLIKARAHMQDSQREARATEARRLNREADEARRGYLATLPR